MKLRSRFILIVGVLPFVLLTVIAYTSFRHRFLAINRIFTGSIDSVTETLAAQVSGLLSQNRTLLRNLAHDSFVKAMIIDSPLEATPEAIMNSPHWPSYAQVIKDIKQKKHLPILGTASTRNRLPLLVDSWPEVFPPTYSVFETGWFGKAISSRVYTLSPPRIENNKVYKIRSMSIIASFPVYRSQGGIAGVVFCHMPVKGFHVLIARYKAENERWGVLSMSVIDKVSSRVIAASGLGTNQEFSLAAYLNRLATDDPRAVIESATTTLQRVESTEQDGKANILYHFAPIEHSPWVAVVRMDERVLNGLTIRSVFWGVFGFVVVLLLLCWGIVFFLHRSIITSLERGTLNLKKISEDEKDFTLRLAEGNRKKGKGNEIALFVVFFNRFIEKFHTLFRAIIAGISQEKKVSENLLPVVSDATSSVSEIAKSITNIEDQIGHFETGMNDAIEHTESINLMTHKVRETLANQTSLLVSLTSEVSEMLSSIETISCITSEKKGTTSHLSEAAERGKEWLGTTMTAMEEGVVSKVNDILEMVESIHKVSSQTNLLSMNAAIEAANAGETGRGFAVVADEIRKLAEMARESSLRISEIIREIVENIETTFDNEKKTSLEFDNITQEITSTISAFAEITDSVNALNEESKQISLSIQVLKDSSQTIYDNTLGVESECRNLRSSQGQVQSLSRDMKNNVHRIVTESNQIEESTVQVETLDEELQKLVIDLQKETKQFKV